MNLSFSPVRMAETLQLNRKGDILEINGTLFDFSDLPEGGSLSPETLNCAWIASDVRRIAGSVQLQLILPHGANAPQETLFPAPITLEADGPVTLPLYDVAPPVLAPAEPEPVQAQMPDEPSVAPLDPGTTDPA
jgi:hypothetical protein